MFPVKLDGTQTYLQEVVFVIIKHFSFIFLFMAINSIVINPFVIHCSKTYPLIKLH